MNRTRLERVLSRSLSRIDLAARVADTLPELSPRRRAFVIAVGKAAPAMAKGAIGRWGRAVEHVLVVTTDGTDASSIEALPNVEIVRAAHPLPDARSVRAAERCLSLAQRAARASNDHVLLVLVSGGASALVCAPGPGVRLATKRAVTRVMLESGATIQEMNVVRKHLSRIKGGALARAAAPARVVTSIASDVLGGRASEVGSGPSVGDESTVAEARRLLRRYAPAHTHLPLVRTGRVANELRSPRIVASPEELANVLAAELRRSGLDVRVLAPSQASVDELAAEYVRRARGLGRGDAIVRAAEPAVALPRSATGKGGRSCHLAALVGAALPEGVTFAAASTDGVDGRSGTAGAIVDGSFVRTAGRAAIARALARFDTGPLHLRARTALSLRPTGHNLADVHVLVRA